MLVGLQRLAVTRTDSISKSIVPRSRDEDSALARQGDKGSIDLEMEWGRTILESSNLQY